jgi:2,5-diamino-6-(ribosylamino)-4(3H)-pyrimidinone 5'-phosphate reductase
MKKQKRPFVFMCTGMSLDGKISNFKKECSAISSDDDRNFLYDNRIAADAIMIGGNTLRLDDSGLTVKSPERQNKRIKLGKSPEPIKICIISDANNLKISGDFFDKGTGEKIIFTTSRTSKIKMDGMKKKAKIFVSQSDKINLKRTLETLYKLGIKKLLVEGGGELIFSLLKENLIDEINLKIGDLILGGRDAVTMCEGEGFDKLGVKKVKFISISKENKHLILKAKVIN